MEQGDSSDPRAPGVDGQRGRYAVVEYVGSEREIKLRTRSLMRARVVALMLIRDEHRSVIITAGGE